METKLWLGTSKIDITPQHSVPLAGFSLRSEDGGCKGITHPLYARIFYYRHMDGDGRETQALLVSADLIWWGSERVPQLKLQIHEKWGIPEDSILLHGTHTHSGPQTSTQFSDLLGKADLRYIVELEALVLEGIGQAMADREAVHVEFIRGRSDIGINRRKMVDGQCDFKANPGGPHDSEVQLVRYRSLTGETKALLVHFACHPVANMENWVSSEFCGAAMDTIEQTLGGGVVSAYLQGCCGDINPAGADGELILKGNDDEVTRIAKQFAGDVLGAMNGEWERLEGCPLTARIVTLSAPLQNPPSAQELVKRMDEPGVIGEWSRKLLECPPRLQPQRPLDVVTLTLAEGLSVVAMNAEVVVEYGLYIKEAMKEACNGRVLPLGYTNGMIGYIPTAAQIGEGGYEAYWSTHYFLLPAPFSEEIEPMLRQAIREIAECTNA